MTVAEGIVQFIQNKKLKNVFGVSGANIEELFFSFAQSSVKPVLAKTEYQAALMAIGSYLASQQIHLVLTTSGAGVLNTLPVLAEAYSNRQPLVLIAGLPPAHLEGNGAFQDTSSLNGSLNLEALLKPLVSFQQKITASEQILQALQQAWQSAQNEKRPAVLLVNRNIFSLAWVAIEPIYDNNVVNSVLDTKLLKEKLTALKDRPLFILGEELFHLKNKYLLTQLVENYNAIITCTPQAKGFYDHADSRFAGLIGMMASAKTKEIVADAKNVVVIGSRMDHLSRFGFEEQLKEKTIFHLSAFSEKAFIQTHLSVHGNLDHILESLL